MLGNRKANGPPAKLNALPDPVEFSEELRATHELAEHNVLMTAGSDPAVIRVAVSFELQGRKGPPSEREVV